MPVEEVFILDVLKDVSEKMQVQAYPVTNPVSYLTINFNPGTNNQILENLLSLDAAALSALKYPLFAVSMPFSEKSSLGFLEVVFPKIIFANLTKTNTGEEKVLDKYEPSGIIKTILRPCVRQFIEKLAWSQYTSQGDPDSYEFTSRDLVGRKTIGEGINDYVDIIEILNLKVIFYPQIKSC